MTDTTSLQRVLDRFDRVPTSAGIAQRVLQLIDDPDFDIGRVVRLLETDPALAAQILKLVNSSYFGLPRQVASLRQAIGCLGTHTLRLALLNFGVLQCLAKVMPAQHQDAFFRHALTMAIAAKQLTALRDEGDPEAAYCAALVADVGALVLFHVERDAYAPLCELASEQRVAAERERFGFDHAQLGARLFERWNLPSAMVCAIAAHHDQVIDESCSLVRAVQAADLAAEVLWRPQSNRVTVCRAVLREHYGLDTDGFIQFAIDCRTWLAEHAGHLNVRLKSEIDVAALRQSAIERFVAESVAAAVELDGIAAMVEIPLAQP